MRRLGTTSLVLALVCVLASCGGTDQVDISGDDSPAPATPGALVAVALSHMHGHYRDKDIDRIESPAAAHEDREPRTIGAQVWFDPGGNADTNLVSLTVGPRPPVPVLGCPKKGPTCVAHKDAGGITLSFWDKETEEDPGSVAVVRYTSKDVVSVLLSGPEITKPYGEMDLPWVGSLKVMQAIADDPAFGSTTTRGALAAAKKLRHWKGSTSAMPAAQPDVPWTPRMLGALAYYRLNYFDEDLYPSRIHPADVPEPEGTVGTGAGIRFYPARLGTVAALYLITDPPPGATRCPRTYHCVQEGPLTYGWTPKHVVLFRQEKGFLLRLYVRDYQLDTPSRKDFDSGYIKGLVDFTADPEIGPTMSGDWATVENPGAGAF